MSYYISISNALYSLSNKSSLMKSTIVKFIYSTQSNNISLIFEGGTGSQIWFFSINCIFKFLAYFHYFIFHWFITAPNVTPW
jgi:hypothetical protein